MGQQHAKHKWGKPKAKHQAQLGTIYEKECKREGCNATYKFCRPPMSVLIEPQSEGPCSGTD